MYISNDVATISQMKYGNPSQAYFQPYILRLQSIIAYIKYDNSTNTTRPVHTHCSPKNIGFHEIFKISAGKNNLNDLTLFFK